MKPSLRVLEPGLLTTVQDLGRVGWQRFGIPVSGATDPVALRAANVLVGNPQGTAGLEMAMIGPCLEVDADSVRVAVAGGDTVLTVEPAEGGEIRRIAPLESTTLSRGDRLRVGAVPGTAVAYLAVAGGFALQPFLGSLSTYVRGGFGGIEGRALRAGDELPLALDQAPTGDDVRIDRLDLAPARTVRVVLGPQDDYFTPEALNVFLGSDWLVTRDADRMGLRLDGPALTHSKGANIVSDGIAPGAIQVPGNGLPIVLLADRQTTGGYPKIATVISADLPALGRVTPGARLRFEQVSLEQAEAARTALETRMRGLAGELLPARKGSIDLGLLMSANLISGVTDGSATR
jgi:biotin-dependent carboxylase-like uncharacterized protein